MCNVPFQTNIEHSRSTSRQGSKDELLELDKNPTFVVSLCQTLQAILSSFGFDNKHRLNSLLKDPAVLTVLPLVSMQISFLNNILYNSKELLDYIYNKLFSKYLLKILFFHEDIGNVEVMYLKKSIS